MISLLLHFITSQQNLLRLGVFLRVDLRFMITATDYSKGMSFKFKRFAFRCSYLLTIVNPYNKTHFNKKTNGDTKSFFVSFCLLPSVR